MPFALERSLAVETQRTYAEEGARISKIESGVLLVDRHLRELQERVMSRLLLQLLLLEETYQATKIRCGTRRPYKMEGDRRNRHQQ